MDAAASTLVVLVLLVAGCLVPPEEGGDGATATMATQPAWSVGDWWTYQWDSEIYGYSFETTVVVGAASEQGYHVGMPVDDYTLDALLFHLPAVGFLSPELAYSVHETDFAPLAFPLSDGARWNATYITAPVRLTAHASAVETPSGDAPGFLIDNDGHAEASGRHYRMGYAPSVEWFTFFERVELDGTVRERITLLETGSDFSGEVRLIEDIRVPYLDARTQGGFDTGGDPAPPVATFDPDDELDLIFAACLYGDGPGAYDVSIENANGPVCRNTGTVTDDDDLTRRIEMVEVPNLAGDWTVRLGALGNGLAIAEVLGYKSWDVTLGDRGGAQKDQAGATTHMVPQFARS